MKTFRNLILLMLLLCNQYLLAANINLYVWDSGETIVPLIIPVRETETPEQAAERYLHEISKSTELLELFEGRLPHLPKQGFTLFSKFPENHYAKNTLLIANLPKDFTKNTLRVQNFTKIFSQAQQKSFILPINANLGLSHTETKDFFNLVQQNFSMLVAMGGEDVDPQFYKKENYHSRNTIPIRDQFEIQLIKSYTKSQTGFLLGVCRGSQITAVALGYSLIQDIPFHREDSISHSDSWHDIQLKPTTHNILSSLSSSYKIHVNSLHHQSVIYKPGGPLEIAATAEDGITEATEFKNGKGLLLQFHPELMGNQLGTQILNQIVQQKNKILSPSCRHILR